MLSDVTHVAAVVHASTVEEELPVACSLTEAELRVRGEENGELFTRVRAVEELPDGYRFAFPPEDEGVSALLRFVLAERACCPFFTFEMALASPHREVWLAIRGNDEAKAIVRDALVAKVHVAR